MRSVIGVLGIGCVLVSACGSPRGGNGGGIDFGDGGGQDDARVAAEGGANPDAMPSADGGGDLCAAACARALAAGCPAFTAEVCAAQCEQFTGTPACLPLGEAALRCSAAASFRCNAAGSAVTSDCASEGMALVACLTS